MKELEIGEQRSGKPVQKWTKTGTLIMFTEKMNSKNRLKSILILERINHFSV